MPDPQYASKFPVFTGCQQLPLKSEDQENSRQGRADLPNWQGGLSARGAIPQEQEFDLVHDYTYILFSETLTLKILIFRLIAFSQVV